MRRSPGSGRSRPATCPYLDFLAPGILAQSALFVSIFYGIQIIWERDAGILTKLMVTPTPAGRAGHRQGVRRGRAGDRPGASWSRAVLRCSASASRRTRCAGSGVAVVVVLGAAFFCCLSITIAGLVLKRDRLMGIGQAITMPLFFASNALYPVALMPVLAAGASATSTR